LYIFVDYRFGGASLRSGCSIDYQHRVDPNVPIEDVVGAVITEAGNDPKVVGLVYITAFAPDKGESVATLVKDPQPGAPVAPILPPQDGYLFLDRAKFRASFAADVDAERAAFMADSQVPWGVERQDQ
jgi:hypothetical protein